VSWIEDTLAMLQRQRQRLEAPAPAENAPQPTGPAAMTGAPGPGAMGLPGVGRDVSQGPARSYANVAAYQKYLRRSGRKHDPLLDTQQVTPDADGSGGSFRERTPARVRMDAAGQAMRVNTTGNERRGLSFQQFRLPGGRRVNVYYGANGERTVVHLPKRKT
jgi:hypothetical protein